MSEEKIAHENVTAPQAGAPYGGPNPGYMNRGNYFPQGNYRDNYQDFPQGPRGYYRAGYQPYAGRGAYGNYPNGRMYEGPYGGYKHHYDHDDDDYHYHDHPYYHGFGSYGYGPYRRFGPYCPRPGMGYHHWMHDHHDHYGQPPYGAYGSMMMYPGPFGFLRNWISYNPVTNWARSPRGTSFLRGLGIATAGIILAPAVIRTIRPLAVQAVHGVMSIVGEMKGVVADAREELEDIFADAKWDNMNKKDEKLQEG